MRSSGFSAILIEDTRFVRPGLRPDGVFLGERDQLGDPLPEFIGARPEDLNDLIASMLQANDRMRDRRFRSRAEGGGHRLRICLHSSVPGRQWPDSSLPDPSCSCGAEIHAAGNDFSGLIRHARSDR